MGKGRLEAFSDGVLAIIITIMVLEMKVPHDASAAGIDVVDGGSATVGASVSGVVVGTASGLVAFGV